GCGAENNTKLRFIKPNNEPYINVTETWLLSGFNTNSKAQSFYNLTNGNLNLVYLENANLQFWQKARGCNELLFRKSTATQYPDLYLADLGFLEVQRLTNAAAHQDTFNWVKVNPVTFKAKSGKQLNGLIYLPENFDSANTYPAIIYFYEKYSDRLHQYYTPKPSA